MEFKELIGAIVDKPEVHAKWLNTLSLLENTGARKISLSEDKTGVTLLILKHAAEEHRHAYYLKKQIEKIDAGFCPDYSQQYLLAPKESRIYLNMLDVYVCRYLKSEGIKRNDLKFAAYLLVTYAIELRADDLYPVYQEALDRSGSRVNVKSIIAEEEGHLEEMIHQLQQFFSDWKKHASRAVEMESRLFGDWVIALTNIPGIA